MVADLDSVIPFTGKCQERFSFKVIITLQLYVLIEVGLNLNGISSEVKGDKVMFFLFCIRSSNTLSSFPIIFPDSGSHPYPEVAVLSSTATATKTATTTVQLIFGLENMLVFLV